MKSSVMACSSSGINSVHSQAGFASVLLNVGFYQFGKALRIFLTQVCQ